MQLIRFVVLTALERHGSATASELATVAGTRREAAAMLLLRARRDGLVRFHRRTRRHRLSERGRDRLAWLRGRQ
jgi:DNA-binding MarR family transcriptional regulator